MLRLQSYDRTSWKSENSEVFSKYNSFKFCKFAKEFFLYFKVLNISSSLFQTLMNVKKIHRTTANNFVWIFPLLSSVIVATDTHGMLMAAVVMVRDCTVYRNYNYNHTQQQKQQQLHTMYAAKPLIVKTNYNNTDNNNALFILNTFNNI